jgi:Heavy metal binding domain
MFIYSKFQDHCSLVRMLDGVTRKFAHFPSPAAEPRKNAAVSRSAAAAVYACPMHPEVQETKPGNCSICGMTLVQKAPAPEGAKP